MSVNRTVSLLTAFPVQGGLFSIIYDEAGPRPVVSLENPDGAMEVRGQEEIRRVTEALLEARRRSRRRREPIQ